MGAGNNLAPRAPSHPGIGQRLGTVCAVAITAIVAACGATAGSPAGSAAAVSPTATPRPSGDPVAADLSRRAVLAVADLGTDWITDDPGRVVAATPRDCDGAGPGNPAAGLPDGASRLGPQAHRRGTTWWLSSSAKVFTTEADAKAWLAIRTGPAAIECYRASLEREEKARDAKFTVVDVPGPAPPSDGTPDLFSTYDVLYPAADGTPQGSGRFTRLAYRSGRVVISVNFDIVAAAGDPPNELDLFLRDFHRALAAAQARAAA
jgi:hypothetical protein